MLLCWFSYICARACVRWVCGESKGTCQPACCWWSIQRGNWARPSGKLATHHLRIHTRGGFHTVTNPLTSPLKLVESIICTSIPWYSFASMASLYNFLKTTKNKSKCMKRNFAIHLNSFYWFSVKCFWCYYLLWLCWKWSTWMLQVDSDQFEKILRIIRSGVESGANLKAGGDRFGTTGYYIQPTVFSDVQVYFSSGNHFM